MISKRDFLHEIKRRVLFLDGAMGTLLQSRGYFEDSAMLNLTKPEVIQKIHKDYCEAGANMILTNTFGATRYKLNKIGFGNKVEEINRAAVQNVRIACPHSIIVGELGPLGEFVEPLGKLSFDEAYENYKEQVLALHGADVIIIDTISDIRILKAAIIAAKENFNGPIISSMTIQEGRASTGTDPLSYITVAEGFDVDVIGINCGDGPDGMFETAKTILRNTNKPFCVQPNAGLPKMIDGRTVWDYPIKRFADFSEKFVKFGANIVGGCCGTNPDFIREITNRDFKLVERFNEKRIRLCSRTKSIVIKPTLIAGERINPTNKKRFIEELKNGKTDYIRNQALQQVEEGADLLDVNVGALNIDEKEMLVKAVKTVESVVDVPIILDSSNPEALESALKEVSGKALINSVNGSEKSMNLILPLAKKYGASVIGLCVDDNGIPKDVKERVEIAERIIKRAKEFNVDVIIDGVVLTMVTNPEAFNMIINALKEFKKRGFKTILGLSNISHGLPDRAKLNSKFYTECSKNGLDIAIMDPIDNIIQADTSVEINVKRVKKDFSMLPIKEQLYNAILYGDKDNILNLIEKGLETMSALNINDILISALEEVGEKYERKEYFLPNVLASANTMRVAFQRLKKELKKDGEKSKGLIMFATVENDVHDIGKNIVIALLESHNFNVVNLGVNVKTETIIKKAKELKPDVIALSALMTTTASEMKEIVKKLKEEDINIPVTIGGAVVNDEYAKSIGTSYSKDALGAVKLIEDLLDDNK